MSKNLRKIIKNLILEELPYIADINETHNCKWDFRSTSEIKIFFDIEKFWGAGQSWTGGRAIIIGNFLKNLFSKKGLGSASHSGFIFQNGDVFQSSPSIKGVGFSKTKYKEILEQPQNFVIVVIKGTKENILYNFCKKLDILAKNTRLNTTYNYLGVYEQIPIVGNALRMLKINKKHKFAYQCAELVVVCLEQGVGIELGYDTGDIDPNSINHSIVVSPTDLYYALSEKTNSDLLLSNCDVINKNE